MEPRGASRDSSAQLMSGREEAEGNEKLNMRYRFTHTHI